MSNRGQRNVGNTASSHGAPSISGANSVSDNPPAAVPRVEDGPPFVKLGSVKETNAAINKWLSNPTRADAFFNEMEQNFVLDGSKAAAARLPGRIMDKLLDHELQASRAFPCDG